GAEPAVVQRRAADALHGQPEGVILRGIAELAYFLAGQGTLHDLGTRRHLVARHLLRLGCVRAALDGLHVGSLLIVQAVNALADLGKHAGRHCASSGAVPVQAPLLAVDDLHAASSRARSAHSARMFRMAGAGIFCPRSSAASLSSSLLSVAAAIASRHSVMS